MRHVRRFAGGKSGREFRNQRETVVIVWSWVSSINGRGGDYATSLRLWPQDGAKPEKVTAILRSKLLTTFLPEITTLPSPKVIYSLQLNLQDIFHFRFYTYIKRCIVQSYLLCRQSEK